jgi:hypothetical protein
MEAQQLYETEDTSLSDVSGAQESMVALVRFFAEERDWPTKKALYTMLAEKLSAAIGREDPWTWRYAQGVHSGTIKPSQDFMRAINVWMLTLDEVPAAIANAEQVTVLAEPGTVLPNALILGKSQPCAYAKCSVVFVPRVPWQKYHDPKCGYLARRDARGQT